MSISASMNAGVLGLAANSTRLSTIADNLANGGTVGYKRADVQFSSLVASQSSDRQYWAGGVLPSVRHAITEQGVIQTTSASTDFAVSGRGCLPVVNTTMPGAVDAQQDEFLLTSAGSFRTDADGFLRNAGGLYLLGWLQSRWHVGHHQSGARQLPEFGSRQCHRHQLYRQPDDRDRVRSEPACPGDRGRRHRRSVQHAD
jgi:flagellar hook-basal body protein